MKIYLCWLVPKTINLKCLMWAYEKKERAEEWLKQSPELKATKEIQEVSVIMGKAKSTEVKNG